MLLSFSNLIFSYTIIASKGISANLLKPSAKRRRTKHQVQMDKINA